MTIKLGRKYLFILAVCTFLWNQHTGSLTQKIAIENSYQQKVSAALSSLLGQEKFLVIVSIEFSTIGGTLKKTSVPQSGSNSASGYIPGLPTVPSNQSGPKSNNLGSKGPNESDLEIGRVDILIGMNETSITPSVKPNIEALIKKIIPKINDCEDCIKIEAMEFQTSQKNKRLAELEEQIELLEKETREADLKADENKIKDLEKQLEDAEGARTNYESMENLRQLEQLEQEKIRFKDLINAERIRKEQDSIKFINTEKRLERVMESKIKSDSVIIRETMGIVKQQAGGGNESLLGMQVGSGSSSIMSYVLIIFLIISLMVVTFLAANNRKPKTIYLKPKSSGKEKKKGKDSKDKKSETDVGEINETKEETAPEVPAPTTKPDEDAMRSELRSLRQTAVSLTVGEKEGASTLIKEWLEDNPNKEDESAEEAGEE